MWLSTAEVGFRSGDILANRRNNKWLRWFQISRVLSSANFSPAFPIDCYAASRGLNCFKRRQ